MNSTLESPSGTRRRVRVAPNLYQRPKDRKFEAGLTIDGRWTMKTLKARTKADAKLELAALQLSNATPAQATTPPPTLKETAEAWLASFELQVERGERSARTLEHYGSTFRCHIESRLGSQTVDTIGPDDICAFYDLLRAEGKSVATLRACHDVLSRLFKFAIRRGAIDSSPIAKLEPGERPRPARREQRILAHRELNALFASSEGDAYDLIALHTYTGMRQGEILGLTWSEIDFEAGVIRVRRQLQRPRKGCHAQLAPLKTRASAREVVLLPQLASLLAARRLAAPFSADDDFVFSRGPGMPLHYSAANRLLHRAAAAAGIVKVRSHDFRHTYASHLIVDLGLDVIQVQRQLGHAKPSITLDKYAHLFDRRRHGDALRNQMAQSAFGALLQS